MILDCCYSQGPDRGSTNHNHERIPVGKVLMKNETLKIKVYKPSKEIGPNIRESVESDLQFDHIFGLSDVKYKRSIFNMFSEEKSKHSVKESKVLETNI